jgi:chromosome segregation ATPase
VSARATARRWAGRLAGRRVRDLVHLPREVAELRAGNAELQERLARLEAELQETRVHAGRADDAIARLTEGLSSTSAALEHDLAENRRLSHRVAQMTDVVFDRLAERPAAQPA